MNFVLALSLSFLFPLSICSSTGPSSGTQTAPKLAKYPFILIGIDGFDPEYFERGYNIPNLTRLANMGIMVEYIEPVYPALSYPNLFTIVTGKNAANHGIVSNKFYDTEIKAFYSKMDDTCYDTKFYMANPWTKSAVCMWPGSYCPINGMQPTYFQPLNLDMTEKERIDWILDKFQLPEEQRPSYYSLYFDRVDEMGHDHGRNAPQIKEAVEIIDSSIGYLLERLKELGYEHKVNLIVMSDHGMTDISPERALYIDQMVDMDDIIFGYYGAHAYLNVKDGKLDKVYNTLKAIADKKDSKIKVLLREEVPEDWHYQSPRVSDILVIPDPGWVIFLSPFRPVKGIHGYPLPNVESHGMFMAYGPSIKKNSQSFFNKSKRLPPPCMTDVYNLMCKLLDVEPEENDGSMTLIDSVYVEPDFASLI